MLLFLTTLAIGVPVLVYVILKSTKMTRNLVEIIKALRVSWEQWPGQ